jgi:hypothetical protein
MTEPREPGERRPPGAPVEPTRLERPPGERYVPPVVAESPREPSAVRAIVIAVVVALAGAFAMVMLAGQLAVSSGLLIMAVVIGRFVGLGLRTARGALSPGRARVIALLIAVGGMALAQLGIWVYARSEGGVLELVDYLGQTFGPLVPLEIALAAVVAVLSAD